MTEILVEGVDVIIMSTVIVVGLSLGTLFTLLVQPAVYAIFVDQGMTIAKDESDES